jgi:hypothetical protein
MTTNLDLIGRDMDSPVPPQQVEQQNIWTKLQSYVQNDARINLDARALRNKLFTYDNNTVTIKQLRSLIGPCVRGYQNKKGMQEASKLDVVIDYLELLRIVLPVSNTNSENQSYVVNLSAELTESFDFLFDDKQLFIENIKEYVKHLIK